MIAGFCHYILFAFSLIVVNSGTESNRLKPGSDEHRLPDNVRHHKIEGAYHPLYVAVAEIEYKNSDKFATLACKIFSDDLELALQKQYGKKESFNNPADVKSLSGEIDGYIKNHLQLKINGKQSNYSFINFKTQDNAVLIYFRINDISEISTFAITDTILYEVYSKQVHLVYVTVNGNRKSGKIANPVSQATFEF